MRQRAVPIRKQELRNLDSSQDHKKAAEVLSEGGSYRWTVWTTCPEVSPSAILPPRNPLIPPLCSQVSFQASWMGNVPGVVSTAVRTVNLLSAPWPSDPERLLC